jgi:hypothetical protein
MMAAEIGRLPQVWDHFGSVKIACGWDRAPTRRLQVEGYQARSFDCELGSHFHHGYVFEGPPYNAGRPNFRGPV